MTILNRVVLTSVIEMGMSREEEQEIRKQKQMETLQDGDRILRMTYKNYKKHYSDCETVIGSYDKNHKVPMVEVIVRNGRLKKSGTRGKVFYDFKLVDENGCYCWYKAIDPEHAMAHAMKDFPDDTFSIVF